MYLFAFLLTVLKETVHQTLHFKTSNSNTLILNAGCLQVHDFTLSSLIQLNVSYPFLSDDHPLAKSSVSALAAPLSFCSTPTRGAQVHLTKPLLLVAVIDGPLASINCCSKLSCR